MSPMIPAFIASVLALLVVGCAGPAPIEEYSLARTAIQAAKEHGAASGSPGFWHRAEESFRKGQKAFKENDNFLARQYFQDAIEQAEKAENATRLKNFRSGGGF